MNLTPLPISKRSAAFTMVEIAICLAIIGLALVAIIGVLPIGMNVQRDNREETIINQDASVLLESIRNGVRVGDDLTNYVYSITNYWAYFGPNGVQQGGFNANGYTYNSSSITPYPSQTPPANYVLTNNARIIGLLSTPEFIFVTNGFYVATNNLQSGGISNHVIAYVRSMSGLAVEKPPQDNPILRDDSFTYRILSVNAPLAEDTNIFNLPLDQQIFERQLAVNLHELRLSFYWPVQPSGALGAGRQTQRTMIAGIINQTNDIGQLLFYYQSQLFTNAP